MRIDGVDPDRQTRVLRRVAQDDVDALVSLAAAIDSNQRSSRWFHDRIPQQAYPPTIIGRIKPFKNVGLRLSTALRPQFFAAISC
jgi:hypothetical protein